MQLPRHSDSRLAPHEAEALWRAWTVRKDAAARDRLVLSYEALADGVTPDDIVRQVTATVIAPRVAPSQDRTAVIA